MGLSVESVHQLSLPERSVVYRCVANCGLVDENSVVIHEPFQHLSGIQTTRDGTDVILGQFSTAALPSVDTSEFCRFSHLTTLKAPRMKVENSSFLEYLPNLVNVFLSSGRLTEISGILYCSHAENVDLSHNRLEHLPDLSTLKFLRTLDLSYNELRSIEGVRGCQLLQRLYLGNNHLVNSALLGPNMNKLSYGPVESVLTLQQSFMNSSPGRLLDIKPPLLELNSLSVLNLSQNCDLSIAADFLLTDQERSNFIKHSNSKPSRNLLDCSTGTQGSEDYGIFPVSLTQLYLNGCKISALSGLTALRHLNVLTLRDNEIVDHYELKRLQRLRLLRNLDVRNNPVCEQTNYRFQVIHLLDKLVELDEQEISSEDKVRSREFLQPKMEQIASQDHRVNVLYQTIRPQQLRACTLQTLSIPYPILALIGPTGSNKRLLCQLLVRLAGEYFQQVKCHTDRPPRRRLATITEAYNEQLNDRCRNSKINPHDIGVDEVDEGFYYFVDTDTFKHKRESGDFIQTAVIMDYQYGLSWSSLEDVARKGLIAVFTGELEAQLSLKLSCLQPHYILCLPTNEYAHELRLRSKYVSTSVEPNLIAGPGESSTENAARAVENRVQWCLRRTSDLYQDIQRGNPEVFDGVIHTDDIHTSFIKLTEFVQGYLNLESDHPLIQRMLNSD